MTFEIIATKRGNRFNATLTMDGAVLSSRFFLRDRCESVNRARIKEERKAIADGYTYPLLRQRAAKAA